jgi:hypothetical protein
MLVVHRTNDGYHRREKMGRRDDKVPESIYIYIFVDVNSTVAVKEG